MKYAWIDGERKMYPLPAMCTTLAVSISGYRAWKRAGKAKLFGQFVAGGWTTNDRFYLLGDTLCVDFVIRYECLNDDLGEVCRRVGLPAIELPHPKSGLRAGGHSYVDYYDERTKAIVAKRHENDIRLFGYEF